MILDYIRLFFLLLTPLQFLTNFTKQLLRATPFNTHLTEIDEHRLNLDQAEEPLIKPSPPFEIYTQLKRLPSSAYSKIPVEPISVTLSSHGYGIVNLERLANEILKEKFFTILFGSSLANHVRIEQWERDPVLSICNAIYSCDDSEGVEAAENYLETTPGSPTRLMCDLLVSKMLQSGSVTDILVLLLNVRKILTPGHCIINDALLHGLSLLNYLQVLKYQDRDWGSIVDQNGKISLDIDDLKFQKENLYSNLTIIRYLPFVALEFNPNDYRNRSIIIDDLFDHEWELKVLRLFLSRSEVCVFELWRDEWYTDKLRTGKPNFSMEFKADACYTPEGLAHVNPATFKLVNSILNPFKDFPLALVDLKSWTEGEVLIRPITFYSSGRVYLTFMESTQALIKAPTGHLDGYPNLLAWMTGSNRNSGFNYADLKMPSTLNLFGDDR